MTSEQLFIWVYLPGLPVPVLAGRIDFSSSQAKTIGSFVYGKEYLSRLDALPLDPVVLPLSNILTRATTFATLNGLPGAVADSCPDKWGMRIIDQIGLPSRTKQFPLNYLLVNDPGRVGGLAFSFSVDEPPVELSSRQFLIGDLLRTALDVESNKPVDPELLKALHPGTGGARPKCNIVDEDGVWLAKFPSGGDMFVSNPRLEHATMCLAKVCGLNAAETKIKVVDGFDVCLVKRFDREIVDDKICRKGFLSARTVFYGDAGFAQVGVGSYGRLARWLPKYGCDQADKTELYRRMVFNVAVRNSDDHELNGNPP